MSSSLVTKWTPARVATAVRWCGAGIAALGLLWAAHVAWFILRAQVAEGTVAQWDVVTSKGKDSNGFSTTHAVWYAEVQFKDARGRPHYARSPRGHTRPLWPVGQPVLLHYDPADPEDILISHSSSIWFPPGAILGLGLFLFLLSTLVLTLLRRTAQRNAGEVAEIVAKYISKKPRDSHPRQPTN